MSTSMVPLSHPESAVQILEWLLTVRRIQERANFVDLPNHDSIILCLFQGSSVLQWNQRCQEQFNSTNTLLDINYDQTRTLNDPGMVGLEHQQPATPSSPRRQEGSEDTLRHRRRRQPRRWIHRVSNSVPGQRTLAHARFPYRLRRARIIRTSHARQPSGGEEMSAPMNAPPNPQGPSQPEESQNSRRMDLPAGGGRQSLHVGCGCHPEIVELSSS